MKTITFHQYLSGNFQYESDNDAVRKLVFSVSDLIKRMVLFENIAKHQMPPNQLSIEIEHMFRDIDCLIYVLVCHQSQQDHSLMYELFVKYGMLVAGNLSSSNCRISHIEYGKYRFRIPEVSEAQTQLLKELVR